MTNFIIAGLLASVLSAVLIKYYLNWALQQGWVDVTNHRTIHEGTVPRGAGVVFSVLWIMFSIGIWFFTKENLWWIPNVTLMLILGFSEDTRRLSVRRRLFFQVLIALLSILMLSFQYQYSLMPIITPALVLSFVVAMLMLVWSTNLYNFMDGLDGFATIEGIFLFGLGGWLFWQQQEVAYAYVEWGVVCVLLGFLVWNWPKAKVFMGDSGSYCLGFSTALLALIGHYQYQISIGLWVIMYSVFWFDASMTVLRRALKRQNLAQAHCLHAFQRLRLAGFSQKQILLGLTVVNAILLGIALTVYHFPQFVEYGVLGSLILLSGLYLYTEALNPMWSSREEQ